MPVENIREKFPIKNIPMIIGDPSYKAINELREAWYANAAAIPTYIGGGRNGHIVLIIDASVYANVATTAYSRPADPSPYAQHEPGDSAAARADSNEIHKEVRIIYDLDKNANTALKQEIIAAVEETYLSTKNSSTWNFTVSPPRTFCTT